MQPVPELPAEPSQYVSEGTTFTADLVGHGDRERHRVFECVGNEISLIVEQSSVPGRVGSVETMSLELCVQHVRAHLGLGTAPTQGAETVW